VRRCRAEPPSSAETDAQFCYDHPLVDEGARPAPEGEKLDTGEETLRGGRHLAARCSRRVIKDGGMSSERAIISSMRSALGLHRHVACAVVPATLGAGLQPVRLASG
jgi:hypothetical protein